MAAPLVNNAACTPNYAQSGRRARKLVAYFAVAAAVATFIGLVVANAPWYWRLLLFVPGSMAAGTTLQVSRNTCVARARERTIELDDFSRSAAGADEADASSRVAATIVRDAFLIGLALALLGALTSLMQTNS